MATPDNSTPKHGGSHFDGAAPKTSVVPQGKRPTSSSFSQVHTAPASSSAPRRRAHSRTSHSSSLSSGARAPKAALSGGRVSRRTAAATRRVQQHSVTHEKRPQKNRFAFIIAGAVVLIALISLLVFVVVPRFSGDDASSTPSTVEPGQSVTVTIPDGSGATAIAQILYDNGIISDQSEFLSQVRRTEVEQALKSGAFTFTTGDDITNIINQLVSGPNAAAHQVTIPEGLSVARTASAVEEAMGIPASDFMAQAKASLYVNDFPFLSDVTDDSLEGYLFPKTYSFQEDTVTADMVIRAMLTQYQTEVASLDLASAATELSSRYNITVSEHDIVTLASIVEREALTDEQRGHIASVFYNRLAADMPLQSDATLAYSLQREVTADDLKNDDPYNTYTRKGLTPTPICSPSLASLEAAAHPDDTEDLYFFITPDYESFTKTYEEHQQAIADHSQQ